MFNTLSATRAGVGRKAKGGTTTISSNTYGYIRVSTREQNEDRQLIALREMSIPEQNIFMDKQSGKDFNRPPRPLPENYHSAYQRWKAGVITGTAAAKECGMPLSTFRYRAEIYEKVKLL